ncbi:unnamed protein product [Amoebophrya sp. A120]|nr:unnamed protein product [Amoebophrya sp. A120]|eukprot:GSA120T00003880001.1
MATRKNKSGPGNKEWLRNVDTSPLPTIPHRKLRETGPTGTDITFGTRKRPLGTNKTSKGKPDGLMSTYTSSGSNTVKYNDAGLMESAHYAQPPTNGIAGPPKNGNGGPPAASPVSSVATPAPGNNLSPPRVTSSDEGTSPVDGPAESESRSENARGSSASERSPVGAVNFASHPVAPKNPVSVQPGMNMNILAQDEVPYRLRCMGDPSRTHRIRTTTFLGRSRKKLRPTDLLLEAQDVSKIHCSITTIGNAIAGYKLSVVVAESAKAPVSVNGAKLREKGKPYPLKVGDVLLVGLREMWKLERNAIEETAVKPVVDELELYEAHNEFLQLAISDVETYRNICRCSAWMDFIAIIVELSEKEQALQRRRNSKHQQSMREHSMSSSYANTTTTMMGGSANESGSFFRRTDNTLITLETDPSNANMTAGGNGFYATGTNNSTNNDKPGGWRNTNVNVNRRSTDNENTNLTNTFSSNSTNTKTQQEFQKTLSTFGTTNSTTNEENHNEEQPTQEQINPEEQPTMENYFPSGFGEVNGRPPAGEMPSREQPQHQSGSQVENEFPSFTEAANTDFDHNTEVDDGAGTMVEHPRCADLIEVLDEVGHVLYTFGPLSSFEEMTDFDLDEIREVLAPGLFLRIHLCFFPPLVTACAEWLDQGTLKAMQSLVGGGDPRSLERQALMG